MNATMPDVCLYHHPCSDGFTAAWAIWKRWPNIQFIGANYGQPVPDLTGKHVLLVDFSYKREVLLQIVASAASVTILDHHKSAYEDLQPLLDSGSVAGEFDMARSGAKMAWDYAWPKSEPNPFDEQDPHSFRDEDGVFHGMCGHVPWLVQYVQDRDLWTWALPDSKEISAYIQLTGMSFQAWDKLAQELEDCDGYARAVSIGGALVRKQDSEIAGALKSTKRRMQIADFDVPVANMPYIWASEAGNILCKGEPFAATYIDTPDGRSFSLRSDKDDPNAVDVSMIASYYGGGGHKNAAGFRAPAGWEGTLVSYFGNSGRNALKGLFAFAVFGMFVGLSLVGVLAGIVVSTPWALWYHDPKIVIWPATISMVLAWMWAAWMLFQPRIPNPFRKR